MTKEQAKEYATRIRLGEPVYHATRARVRRYGYGYYACFGAGPAFATLISGSCGWQLGSFPKARSTGAQRLYLEPLLAALDQIANAP